MPGRQFSAEARAKVPALSLYQTGGWGRVLCLGNGPKVHPPCCVEAVIQKKIHRCVDSFIRQRHGPRCWRLSVPNIWVRKRALFCELGVPTEGRPNVCFGRGAGQVKVPASLCAEQMGKGVSAVL